MARVCRCTCGRNGTSRASSPADATSPGLTRWLGATVMSCRPPRRDLRPARPSACTAQPSAHSARASCDPCASPPDATRSSRRGPRIPPLPSSSVSPFCRLRRRQRLVRVGTLRLSSSVDENLPPCPVVLCSDLALREAAFEDLHRALPADEPFSGRRPAPRDPTDEPDDAEDDRAPEQHHQDHHHDPPARADVAVHAPRVSQRNGLRDVHDPTLLRVRDLLRRTLEIAAPERYGRTTEGAAEKLRIFAAQVYLTRASARPSNRKHRAKEKERTMATKLLTHNMGSFDRAVRAFLLAPVAIGIALGVGASSIAGIVLFALAGIPLATAATGVCPGYVPFGIDTRGRAPLPHRP